MALTRVSPSLFATSNNITSVTVGGSANTISLTFDSNGVITGASNNAVSVANTAITGNIISSQISPSVTLNGNTTIASGNLTVGELVRTSANGFQSGNITDSYAKFVYDGGAAQLDITNQYNSGGAGSTYGQIVFKNYNSSGGSLTERVRITGSGNILAQKCISVGAATPSSDGAGITFPATQSASTDANTLDDYEEGTWTPTISGGYTGVTYASQGGWYTKVGRFVNISGRIQFSGTANAGLFSIIGLPFTQGNVGNGAYGGGGLPYTNLAVLTNTSPYCSGNTVEYYTMGGGQQIASSGNASNQWISFVITIATA